jgi:hypothetical protein
MVNIKRYEGNAININFQQFKTETFCMKKASFLELFISSFKEIFPGKSKYAISLYIKKLTK